MAVFRSICPALPPRPSGQGASSQQRCSRRASTPASPPILRRRKRGCGVPVDVEGFRTNGRLGTRSPYSGCGCVVTRHPLGPTGLDTMAGEPSLRRANP